MLRALALALMLIPGVAMSAEEPPDPYLWLEDVNGARAMDWVRAENAKTLKVLQSDPHYQGFFDQALALAEASDRIPMPSFLGGNIWNFWQDGQHLQGIWRSTTPASYATATPDWKTALDLDALSKTDGKKWVWKGATCWSPIDRRCLVSLSDGGEDAVTMREFDTLSMGFASDGFVLPRSKMNVDWLDNDTLAVATDWGPGTMTASGYPFVVKLIRRGHGLGEAYELFRGTPHDVNVQVATLSDGDAHHVTVLQQGLDFFRSAFFQVVGAKTRKLDLPEKAQLVGLVRNRLIVLSAEDFTPKGGAAIPSGSLMQLDMDRPDAPARAIFTPGGRQAIEQAAVTKGRLLAIVLDNVRGRALAFAPEGDGWAKRTLDYPDNVSLDIVSTNDRDDRAFVAVTGFLEPDRLTLVDLGGEASPQTVKTLPPRFDASRDVVEQHEATSKDGTKVPYFVVRPRDMKFDGSAPTLLYAYGGFQVSMLPAYNPALGKLWLERGGVYVLANIRGGGEFGPAWHEAGLKTHRQRIYDDFAAVAEDLIARKITSPRHLGIRGGSNGGLLMGVEFEQHPELWNAVLIEVPLLDMLRFEQIAAGASWVGEYGSVSNPEERAFLAGISPYQNLKAGVAYPEPFIFTTTKDDRVGPVHARKFAARMAEMKLPYLFFEMTEGGHAAGANLREVAMERALEFTYLTRKLME